jgi:hypothetical protein
MRDFSSLPLPLAKAVETARWTVNSIKGQLRYLPPLNLWRRLADRSRPDPLETPHRWLKEPGDLAGRDVCLFVTYNQAGHLVPHARRHAEAWAAHGYLVVLIIAADDLSAFDPAQDVSAFTGAMLRQNAGYDFGAWAAGIRSLPGLREAASLVTVNDSIYGPMSGFEGFVRRLRETPADVIGMTESLELVWHYQSFLVAFGPGALRSDAFWQFWTGVRVGDRAYVIDRYELTLAKRMKDGGLSVTALFPADRVRLFNPTIRHWRTLLDTGFPFVKVQLIRDNPYGADISDWPGVVAAHGFDPQLINSHLALPPIEVARGPHAAAD